MWLIILYELVIFIIDNSPQVIRPYWSCHFRSLILIHCIKLQYLLECFRRYNSIIHFYLNYFISTSYSPCPINRILLRYCDTSAICLGTDILCSPTSTIKFYSSCINIQMNRDQQIRKTVNVVFQRYDQNKDGYLGLPQVESYLNDALRMQQQRSATPEQIRLFMQAADLDCDQKLSKMQLFKILKLTFHSS